MYLATSAEMKRLDRLAIDDFGLPGLVLMENAARSTAEAAFDFWQKWPAKPGAAVLIGPGQNGGDGWALARLFSARGFEVQCFLAKAADKKITGDAAINMGVAEKLGLKIVTINEAGGPTPDWREFDLVIDALFGTGLDRPVSCPAEALLKSAGQAKAALGERLRVLAVDLPSGLSGDDGRLWGPPLPADLTVSLGAPKIGLYLGQGPLLAGRIVIGDIGLCPAMLAKAPPQGRLSTPDEFSSYRPKRPRDGHKGTFGHCLAAGGARGKTGALVLAARAAARSGAALVTALHPASLGEIYESKLTEAMTLDLPEAEAGRLSGGAGQLILEYARNKEALALGPGLGLGPEEKECVLKVVDEAELPLVLDADALTLLVGNVERIKRLKSAVLTPHPGEAARLLGCTPADIQNDRLGAARELAALSGAVVALKGAGTIIAEAGGDFYLNPTGGNHLAVGGSGDALTGLTAGLLAQGMPAFQAAALAVWAHGRAGDLAAEELGPYGLSPDDFINRLPRVWAELNLREAL